MSTEIDSLWDYNDPTGSEARFRAALLAAAEPHLELLTQIARAQGLQGHFDDAHRTLDEVEPGLAGAPPRARIRYLLERGRVSNSAGDPDQARPFFAEAFALAAADPAETFYAIDAAHMLAIVAPADKAPEWNLRALALAEAATDERARGWRGSLLNNLGWTYHEVGDFPAALDYLERALAARRERGTAEDMRVARWCVARMWRDLGRVAEALAEQQALSAEYAALGQSSRYVEEEIDECTRRISN